MAPKKKKNSKEEKTAPSNGASNSTDPKKTKALDVAMKAVQEKFGDASISTMAAAEQQPYDVISTGSLSLDSALGVGGIVRGRLYEFYGVEAGGKSTLAFSVMIEAIKSGLKCLYIDVERSLSTQLLIDMGIDPECVVLVHAYTGEEYLDITEALMATGEFGVCAIDSITALVPTAEAEQDSFGDQSMGLLGRLTSKMCRKLIPLAGRTNTAWIVINQLRDTLGIYSGGPTTTGGKAIRFYATGRISVSGGNKTSRILDKDTGLVIGHRVKFEVVKNKLAPPFRTAEIDLIYGKGYDLHGELLDLGVDIGFVDRSGAWYSYKGEQLGQGRIKARQAFLESPEVYSEVKAGVAKMLGLYE